jgi:hypothetical protein
MTNMMSRMVPSDIGAGLYKIEHSKQTVQFGTNPLAVTFSQ